jgi:hypothetical protein
MRLHFHDQIPWLETACCVDWHRGSEARLALQVLGVITSHIVCWTSCSLVTATTTCISGSRYCCHRVVAFVNSAEPGRRIDAPGESWDPSSEVMFDGFCAQTWKIVFEEIAPTAQAANSLMKPISCYKMDDLVAASLSGQ